MSNLQNIFDRLNDTKDETGRMDRVDVVKNRLISLLSYLSWLVLIPLIFASDSKFARFHVNQGLLLAIAETVAGGLFGILSKLFLIGLLFSIVGWLFGAVCLFLAVIGIVNVASGRAKELPLIGSLRIFR